MNPWWERWPERLKHELKQLEIANVPFRITEQDSRTGILTIELEKVIGGKTVSLQARFPAFYPYIRFEVFAPDLDLSRHQNPITKHLCLIGRSSQNWNVDDTLAAFISERLPLLLRVVADPTKEFATENEEPQGEPVTDFYAYEPGCVVLVDSQWKIDPALLSGELLLGAKPFSTGLNAAVLQVRNKKGDSLAIADPRIRAPYSHNQFLGRWVRLVDKLAASPKELFRQVVAAYPEMQRPRWSNVGAATIEVLGLVVSEEVRWREYADGWMFLVRKSVDRAGFRPGSYEEFSLVRAGRAGPEDLVSRIPELLPMGSKSVSVVGLGCLGSSSALEFGRCGVGKLRLMDGDVVEPATIVRWPMGLDAAGRSKVDVLVKSIGANYPLTDIKGWICKFGAAAGLGGADPSVFDEFLDGTDLIYDATAEPGVHYLLSEMARERGVPFVCTSTTPGAWGGRTVRILPKEATGCWVCLQHFIEDETIPSPPSSPNGEFQPVGCADPTFTGSYFDAAELALSGVRLAVSTLCRDQSAYPDVAWDVAVLTLRGEGGTLQPPEWKTYSLPRHPECPNH